MKTEVAFTSQRERRRRRRPETVRNQNNKGAREALCRGSSSLGQGGLQIGFFGTLTGFSILESQKPVTVPKKPIFPKGDLPKPCKGTKKTKKKQSFGDSWASLGRPGATAAYRLVFLGTLVGFSPLGSQKPVRVPILKLHDYNITFWFSAAAEDICQQE